MTAEVRRQGQISIEYLIIIGVVLLLIVIPSAIFLTSFTQSTVTRTVNQDQIDRLGEGLVDSAEHVYYLGVYSERQTTLPISQSVSSIRTIQITEDGQNYYYIQIITNRGTDNQLAHYYQTSAPTRTNQQLTNPAITPSACEENCIFYEIVDEPGRGERRFSTTHEPTGVNIEPI